MKNQPPPPDTLGNNMYNISTFLASRNAAKKQFSSEIFTDVWADFFVDSFLVFIKVVSMFKEKLKPEKMK